MEKLAAIAELVVEGKCLEYVAGTLAGQTLVECGSFSRCGGGGGRWLYPGIGLGLLFGSLGDRLAV